MIDAKVLTGLTRQELINLLLKADAFIDAMEIESPDGGACDKEAALRDEYHEMRDRLKPPTHPPPEIA
jgi:hypothetical protein